MRSVGVAHSITVVAHPFLLLLGVGGGQWAVLWPIAKRRRQVCSTSLPPHEDVACTVTRADGCQPPMRGGLA
jgi:hypothetical protein